MSRFKKVYTCRRASMRFIRYFVFAFPLIASGCVGPPVLEQQVLGYDQVTSILEQKLLLLNIARVSEEQPVHFTSTSSIAATFDWTTSIGAGGTITEANDGNLFNFDFGASASENPTFQIIPVTGSAFSKQILQPFDENIFQFVAFPRSESLSLVLRMMVGGFQFQNPDGSHSFFVENNPEQPQEYETFRRLVMHLNWLNENRNLTIRPLVFEKVIADGMKQPPRAQDIIKGEDTIWTRNSDGTYRMTRFTAGRLVIANYDLMAMTDNERFILNEKLKKNPKGQIYVEIRPDGFGGDFPIRGTLRLRSMYQILSFIANDITGVKEFDVAPDPRTGKANELNPPETLKIDVSRSQPALDVTWMRYRDRYYSVADTPWDRKAFALLGHLFQTSVGDVENIGIPITISK